MPLFFLIAESVRNLGQYTIGDVIYFRFPEARIRLLTSMSTMLVSMLYMIPQLVVHFRSNLNLLLFKVILSIIHKM